MRTFVVVLCFVTLLAGCGGGGGDPAPWEAVTIGTNEQISGTLEVSDNRAPDGTFFDLYSVTLNSSDLLTINLSSTDFDTVLLLFDAGVLNIHDLNSWDSHLIAISDDLPTGGTDSAITTSLPAGTYVIVANSFDISTGAYTLATSTSSNTLSLSRPFVQFRTFENPLEDHFMGWIDCRDNGAVLQPGDLLTSRLFDPTGTEVLPASLLFLSEEYTTATWDPVAGLFTQIASDANSGFSYNLSNYGSMAPGTYTFEVDPAVGSTLSTTVDFPGKTELPPIASASMSYQWNQDGSLTLSWVEPATLFDQYRVYFADASGKSIFSGRVNPGVNQVTLQAALVEQIRLFNQLPLQTTVSWTMQTRNYIGNNNYARGVSDTVSIDWL